MDKKEKILSYVATSFVVLLFFVTAYFSQIYSEQLTLLTEGKSALFLLIYIAFIVFSTVFAPLSTLALIPVVSNTWGVFVSGVTSIIGWFIGSLIAFYISRKYGRQLVTKIVSAKKIEYIENHFLNRNIFWTIVLLRMIIPVDILSYILGLFKQINWKTYTIATLIGIIPFAFILSYFGTFPLKYQIIEAVPIAIIIYYISRKIRYSP